MSLIIAKFVRLLIWCCLRANSSFYPDKIEGGRWIFNHKNSSSLLFSPRFFGFLIEPTNQQTIKSHLQLNDLLEGKLSNWSIYGHFYTFMQWWGGGLVCPHLFLYLQGIISMRFSFFFIKIFWLLKYLIPRIKRNKVNREVGRVFLRLIFSNSLKDCQEAILYTMQMDLYKIILQQHIMCI